MTYQTRPLAEFTTSNDDSRCAVDEARAAYFNDPVHGTERRARSLADLQTRETQRQDNPHAERDRRDRERFEAIRRGSDVSPASARGGTPGSDAVDRLILAARAMTAAQRRALYLNLKRKLNA